MGWRLLAEGEVATWITVATIAAGSIGGGITALWQWLKSREDRHDKKVDALEKRIETLSKDHRKCEQRAMMLEYQVQTLQSGVERLSGHPAQMEQNPTGIVVANGYGNIIMACDVVCEFLGYEHGELNGKSVDAIVPVRYLNVHHVEFSRAVQSPDQVHRTFVPLPTLCKDGQEIKVDIAVIGWGKGIEDSMFVATMRKALPIT